MGQAAGTLPRSRRSRIDWNLAQVVEWVARRSRTGQPTGGALWGRKSSPPESERGVPGDLKLVLSPSIPRRDVHKREKSHFAIPKPVFARHAVRGRTYTAIGLVGGSIRAHSLEFIFFLVWALFCLGVAGFASSRGRSGVGFFFLSFLFSPLLGLVVAALMKDLAAEARREDERRRYDERQDFDRKREHEKQLESLRAVTASSARRAAGNSGSPASASIADELTKLAALRDNGVLTADEFDQQKRTLLSR